MRITFLLVFFWAIINSYGQDTIPSNQTIRKIDTIIIYKDPVVITKSIVVEEVPIAKSSIWIEGYGAINYYFSHYSVCSNCTDYYNQVKNSTKVLPGVSTGLSLYYNKGNMLGIIGISYSHYREKFTYTNASHINSFNYLETMAGIGYLMKKNKFSCAATASFSLANMTSYQGQTYSPDSANEVVSLGTARKYNSKVPGFMGSIKFMYNVSEKIKLSLEPYYRFDLNSIIYKKSQFTIQRNIFALKAGLLVSLR